MGRPIDILKGALQSKSILLFSMLQFALLAAQPYLASTGVDPALANMGIDIAAVIALRFITSSSLSEKGSGLDKVKQFIGNIDKFIESPLYRPMIIGYLKQANIVPSVVDSLENLPVVDTKESYADHKIYLIGGDKFRKRTDGSFVPIE